MASVRPLKTKWQIRYKDRSRQPTETTDSLSKDEYTEAEAEDEARWRQQLYDRGKYDPWLQPEPDAAVVKEHLTVQEAVGRYIEEKRKMGERGEAGGWSEKSVRSDGPVLRQFSRYVGPSHLIENLRTTQLRAWIYQERLAPTTRYTRWLKLCAMVRFWDDRDWMAEAPRLPGKPERKEKVKTTIRPAELTAICEAYADLRRREKERPHTTVFGQDWYVDAWRVYFYQGFRRSELLDLRVRDVDRTDGMIRIGPEQKKGRGTLIPLVDPAREVLAPYLDGRSPGERVFGTPPGNTRVSSHFRSAVDHAALAHEDFPHLSEEDVPFKPLRKAPSEIDLYTLRHSCCTHWLRERRRLVWVNRLMRHESIETTMQYVHLLPTDLRQMYEAGGS